MTSRTSIWIFHLPHWQFTLEPVQQIELWLWHTPTYDHTNRPRFSNSRGYQAGRVLFIIQHLSSNRLIKAGNYWQQCCRPLAGRVLILQNQIVLYCILSDIMDSANKTLTGWYQKHKNVISASAWRFWVIISLWWTENSLSQPYTYVEYQLSAHRVNSTIQPRHHVI